MQPLRPGNALHDDRQDRALRRWGVQNCHLVDQAAYGAGLSRLMADDDAAPRQAAGVVDHLRTDKGESVRRLLEDAVEMARAGEDAHAADDAWPHGVADELDDLLQDLEDHDAREDLAYGLALDAPAGRTRVIERMLEEHVAMTAQLAGLRRRMGDYAAPGHACATWRLLYVLCVKVEDILLGRMALEEQRLFRPVLRNHTEGSSCPRARSGRVRPPRRSA